MTAARPRAPRAAGGDDAWGTDDEPGSGRDHDRQLRQLAAHGWAYRRLLRRGVLAPWALAAVGLARLLLELAR